jgi:glycosyltransferase involved in cell wall biosynthesis
MKILYYNHTGQVSGAERMLLMILERLELNSFDPVLLCPRSGELAPTAGRLGVTVETVPNLNARFTLNISVLVRYLFSFLQVIRAVRRKVKDLDAALIHANSIRAGLVMTAATIGLEHRVVWHLHDLMPPHPFSTAIRLVALACRRTRMIAVSQAVAKNFVGNFSSMAPRVTTILNGIDLQPFQSQVVQHDVRREMKLSEGDFVVGIVGQLTPRKGQQELIRAFAAAQQELPQSKLLIVGASLFNRDEEYANDLQEMIAELGLTASVFITGARNDIAAVMQALDLLVVNSKTEPFGLVALEAMAARVPVLAAISGGIPELIDHSQNGWLVAQGNEKELSRALVELGQQPALRRRLGRCGKSVVFGRFSIERYVDDLQSFYLGICDPKFTPMKEDPFLVSKDDARGAVLSRSV